MENQTKTAMAVATYQEVIDSIPDVAKLAERRTALEMQTEIDSFEKYAQAWRDLAGEFGTQGMVSASASCLQRADHYARLAVATTPTFEELLREKKLLDRRDGIYGIAPNAEEWLNLAKQFNSICEKNYGEYCMIRYRASMGSPNLGNGDDGHYHDWQERADIGD